MTLITWLRAQLDDDEQTARAAADSMLWHGPVKVGAVWEGDKGFVYTEGQVPGVWDECLWKADTPGKYTRQMSDRCADHVARHDPARVLREVEAKRLIVSEWEKADEAAAMDTSDISARVAKFAFGLALGALAGAYSDRPGYREEWKP